MTVQRPLFLLLLLWSVPIFAAHLFRVRRRRKTVAHLAFWEEAGGEERWTSIWRRIRDGLALALHLLAVCFASGAAAGVSIQGALERSFLFLIDDSPSMLYGSRRSDAALQAAAFCGRYTTPHDRVSWMTLTGRNLSGPEQVPTSYEPRPPAARIAEMLRATHPRDTIVAFVGGSEPLGGTPRVVVGRNVPGPILRDLRWKDSRIALTVENPGDEPLAGSLTINHLFYPISLGPRTTFEWSEPAGRNTEEELIRVRWDPPTFQTLYLVRPPEKPLETAVVTRAPISRFLYQALELLHSHSLIQEPRFVNVQAPVHLSDELLRNSWVILHGCAPDAPLTRGRFLLIDCPPEALPCGSAGTIQRPKWAKFRQGLETPAGGVSVARATLLEGDGSLVTTPEGPIAVYGKRGGLSYVALGFALEDTDLGLTPYFPLFLQWAARWTRDARLFPLSARAGERVYSRYPPSERELVCRHENGSPAVRTIRATGQEMAVPLQEGPGFYTISGETFQETVAVNLDSDPRVVEATDLTGIREPEFWRRSGPAGLWMFAAAALAALGWVLAKG